MEYSSESAHRRRKEADSRPGSGETCTRRKMRRCTPRLASRTACCLRGVWDRNCRRRWLFYSRCARDRGGTCRLFVRRWRIRRRRRWSRAARGGLRGNDSDACLLSVLQRWFADRHHFVGGAPPPHGSWADEALNHGKQDNGVGTARHKHAGRAPLTGRARCGDLKKWVDCCARSRVRWSALCMPEERSTTCCGCGCCSDPAWSWPGCCDFSSWGSLARMCSRKTTASVSRGCAGMGSKPRRARLMRTWRREKEDRRAGDTRRTGRQGAHTPRRI